MGRRVLKRELPVWLTADAPPEPGVRHIQWVLYRRAESYPSGPKGLAIDMDVHESVISNWKHAVRGDNMSPDRVVRLAQLLRMTTDELLGVTTPRPDLNALNGWIDEVIGAADELTGKLLKAREVAGVALSGRGPQEQGADSL